MDFSVIIATRNRPVLVRQAVDSVFAQTHKSVEIVLVDDGSDEAFLPAYTALEADLGERGGFRRLPRTGRGHGQSFAINRGAEWATGDYFCFLDDDDCWTDPDHLSRAHAALRAPGRDAEMYFTCQHAYRDNVRLDLSIWLNPLEERLRGRLKPDSAGVYQVSVENLMVCDGFAHVNNTIMSRALFSRVGGFEETIRYENDRDFYLRAIDVANGLLYSPVVVSRHNVPDPGKRVNLSTESPVFERLMIRDVVWNRARMLRRSPSIRRAATLGHGYTLRRLARMLVDDGMISDGFRVAREALGAYFTVKWLAYCAWLAVRAPFGSRIGR